MNIGIVVSYENSISIPVIKNASKITPVNVVKELMRMRMDLMKKRQKSKICQIHHLLFLLWIIQN